MSIGDVYIQGKLNNIITNKVIMGNRYIAYTKIRFRDIDGKRVYRMLGNQFPVIYDSMEDINALCIDISEKFEEMK
jgi:hypothetical protein